MELYYPWFGAVLTLSLLAVTVVSYYLHICSARRSRARLSSYLIPIVPLILIIPFLFQQGSSVNISVLAMTAILSSFVGMYNSVDRTAFYISIASVATVMYLSSTPFYVIDVFAIGALASLIYARYTHVSKAHRASMHEQRRIELRRDAVQISAWVWLIALFWLFRPDISGISFQLSIFYIVVLLFVVIELSERFKNTKTGRVLHRLEKPGMAYGNGAMILSIGILLLIGFVRYTLPMMFFLSVLVLSDAIATIAGLGIGGPKLPYNRTKSVAGSIAFLVSASAVGYLFIGLYAIPLSAILALIEGMKLPIDDNIRLPVASILIYLFLAYSTVWVNMVLHI